MTLPPQDTAAPNEAVPAGEPAQQARDGAAATAPGAPPPFPPLPPAVRRWAVGALVALVVGTSVACGLLWQKLGRVQQELARRSADSGNQAAEARAVAKAAQELAQETAARQALSDAKLSEVALQRSQLEDLIQSLSRSRDENLVVDIESALRLAQQQAQLTGSVDPLLAALKAAELRVTRAAQPRLAPLQRAITRDIERVRGAAVADLPTMLSRLDELTRVVDELPLMNQVASAPDDRPTTPPNEPPLPWWERSLHRVLSEVRALVRVSSVAQPEAVLLAPEQGFFLRENLKLKLLNARLGLLARQVEASRLDLVASEASLRKYFDPASRKTQLALSTLTQVQAQTKSAALPRPDDTFAALTTAAAGR